MKDNGVDAEWIIDVPGDAAETGLLGRGRNILQYKKRDVTADKRSKIVQRLQREVKGAADKVESATGTRLDSYLLFTNLDLSHPQKKSLERAIGERCEHTIRIVMVGGAELSSFLNSLPHLRSAFFVDSQFATWKMRAESHASENPLRAALPVIGRSKQLAAAKRAVNDRDVRVLVVSGGPDIGKTRLALAATEHVPLQTVFALDPTSLTVGHGRPAESREADEDRDAGVPDRRGLGRRAVTAALQRQRPVKLVDSKVTGHVGNVPWKPADGMGGRKATE